jgi:methyl-CpG-binding domain protein 4
MPGLLQEQLNADPWKIFVCCIFCNMTSRKTAEPYFWKVLERYPTPKAMASAEFDELKDMIKALGLIQRRTRALKNMSCDYLNKDWKDNPSKLYGIGKYGSDAYYLFCTNEWERVKPKDYALKLYQDWLFKEKANEHICT